MDGVFVDMHVVDAIKTITGFDEGEKVLAIEVEQVETNIIKAEVLENDIKAFGELD
jgi:hypothetical protein